MKIALGIEYCGTQYCGWQRQDIPGSIQENVEDALSKIADQHIKIYCAGRTDTGVHALHQVVHFETEAERKMYSWVVGTNVNLPDDISILWAKEVDDDFHDAGGSGVRIHFDQPMQLGQKVNASMNVADGIDTGIFWDRVF